jgi:penicillin amidase
MFFAFFLRSKQPQYKGQKEFSILQNDTEVLFDKWAIPHIYTKNEIDAYRTIGYLHAQDRLFQMEIMRRLAKGELAEILGPDLLKYDLLFRTVGIRDIAERLAIKSKDESPSSKAFEAYLAGVNEFISKGPRPIEFQILGIPSRPFEASDSFAIAGYMAFSFINGLQTDPLIAYIDAHLDPTFKTDILPSLSSPYSLNKKDTEAMTSFIMYAENLAQAPFDAFRGSNGWVMSGEKTRSGKAILANDPHIGYSSPSVWYEASIEYPDFKLYGHYLAGVPFALLGHSDTHAWGLTMLQNKDIDFYTEKRNPNNAKQVWFKDHWENLITRTEKVKIKDQEDHVLNIEISRHGPLIQEVMESFKTAKSPISLKWAFDDEENDVFNSLYKLGHAAKLNDAEEAVSRIHSPGFNVIYTNAEGDIAWWAVARFPIRPEHTQNRFLLDGSSGKDEHLGHYPFSSHPMSINPSEGFIATANQDPFRKHPYRVQGYYNPDFRYDAIVKQLSSKDSGWTVDELKQIQLHTENESYGDMLSHLLPLIDNDDTHKDPLHEAALTLLKTWDWQHSIESQGATIFHEFLGNLIVNIFADRLPEAIFTALRKSNYIHDALVRIVENPKSPWWTDKDSKDQRKEWVQKAWKTSVHNLEASLGPKPMKWNWGRVHIVTHKHILGQSRFLAWFFNIGPLAANGSVEVPNNFAFHMGSGLHEVNYGPSTRRVIDFINPGESWGINPTGQSGYFANAHYRDQAAMYHQGEYRLQILDRKALKDPKTLVLKAPMQSGAVR